MVFNQESSALTAEYVDEKNQKEMKMVDMSVIKKGLNFHGTAQKGLDAEKDTIKKEEKLMGRENDMKSKPKSHKKADDEEEKAASQAAEVEEEREGMLTLIQVQNLPEDVDMIVGQLKTLDFGIQDLDVLIDLAKNLKYKRMSLFPETNYMQSLQQAGLSTEQIMKDK